jgi:hypothetical protein
VVRFLALRFARVATTNSPEDFHLLVSAHAGHTRGDADEPIIRVLIFSASAYSAFNITTPRNSLPIASFGMI